MIHDYEGIRYVEGPGKFEGEPVLTRMLWGASLNGVPPDYEYSDEYVGEWLGLYLPPWFDLFPDAIEAERRYLDTCAGIILRSDVQGFVTGEYFEDVERLEDRMSELLSDVAEPADTYIYSADLWCADCAQKIMADPCLPVPDNPDDEYTYDSGEYPKGPYPDGGGGSEFPNYCGGCHIPLGNSVYFKTRNL